MRHCHSLRGMAFLGTIRVSRGHSRAGWALKRRPFVTAAKGAQCHLQDLSREVTEQRRPCAEASVRNTADLRDTRGSVLDHSNNAIIIYTTKNLGGDQASRGG